MSSAKIEDKFSALELARAAALEDAPAPQQVGELVSISYDEVEDSSEARIATYLFEASIKGYVGWRWAVTVTKVDSDSAPTICDVVLLPGIDSLLAPEWIPYRDRIQPGDVGVGDVVELVGERVREATGVAGLAADIVLIAGVAGSGEGDAITEQREADTGIPAIGDGREKALAIDAQFAGRR